ncbi:MAG: DUF6498-containing protein [Acidobacteriota bacterium]
MTLSIAALIAVNLIPLVGVFFFSWEIGPILLLYWSENLVVGGYNALKIMVQPAEHPIVYAARLFPIAFFCFHYGAFCGFHGFFILGFLDTEDVGEILSGSDWPFFLIFVQILVETIQTVWILYGDVLTWPFLALIISHGVSFIQNFLGKKEYEKTTTQKLMHQPYTRIALLHVAVIFGGWGFIALGSPLPLLMLIIVGKIALDIHLHRREHRPKEEPLET